MPKLQLLKVMGQRVGFVPANAASQIEAEKFAAGRMLNANITTPRSLKHNGWAFQMFTLIAEALNAAPGARDWDQNSVRRRLQIMTGNADMVRLPPATARVYGLDPDVPTVAFEPRSMAFDSMDQAEFGRFCNLAIAYLLGEFGDLIMDAPEWSEVQAILATARQGDAA